MILGKLYIPKIYQAFILRLVSLNQNNPEGTSPEKELIQIPHIFEFP